MGWTAGLYLAVTSRPNCGPLYTLHTALLQRATVLFLVCPGARSGAGEGGLEGSPGLMWVVVLAQ